MKDKKYTLEMVDLSAEDRQVLINHSPKAGNLLSPPPVSIWDNIPGEPAWWKTILGMLVFAGLFYLALQL